MRYYYQILIVLCSMQLFGHVVQARAAASPIDSAARAEANAFFQQQDWKNAAARYQTIVKEEPKNGGAWFRLGVALHGEGKHKEAIEPYKQALRLNFQTTNATFRLARVYAVLKQPQKALDELHSVVKGGFAVSRQGLEMESDFDAIRAEPRYEKIVADAEKNLCATCDAVPEIDTMPVTSAALEGLLITACGMTSPDPPHPSGNAKPKVTDFSVTFPLVSTALAVAFRRVKPHSSNVNVA